MEGVDISELTITGTIEDENISFDIAFGVETEKTDNRPA